MTEPHWVSWSTRPDGGNMFRPTKAHVLAGDHLTACGRVIPQGGLVGDQGRSRFANVSYETAHDTAQAERCRRCVFLTGPDEQGLRDSVLAHAARARQAHPLHASVEQALSAYAADGDPAHLFGTTFHRVRAHYYSQQRG